MGKSFKQYVIAVSRYWKWLVVDLLIGVGTTFTTLLNIPVSVAIPIGLAVIFVGLSIAQFLAYHGLKKDNAELEGKLEEAKLFSEKTRRIDIIKTEIYPNETKRILDEMRKCLSEIISKADEVEDVKFEKMYECAHGDPHQLYLATHKNTIDDNVHSTFYFYNKWNNDISLKALQDKNDKWKQLVEELETVKKDIPDQSLKEYIIRHFQALNGAHSIYLIYSYMKKYGTNELLNASVEPFRPYYGLLDETMTRVSKRILELQLGQEPKWEMLYFKER